jgi:hypothetical protein
MTEESRPFSLLFHHELVDIEVIESARLADLQRQPIEPLCPEDQAALERFIDGETEFGDLPLDVRFYVVRQSELEQSKDPYRYSALPQRLALQLWAPQDGLLLLSGLDPSGALVDWTWENFAGAVISDSPRVRNAQPLRDHQDSYLTPVRGDWDADIAEARRRLTQGSAAEAADLRERIAQLEKLRSDPAVVEKTQRMEAYSKVLSKLYLQWISTDHDTEKRYSPSYFIQWAAKIHYRPHWLDWAERAQLIDAHDGVFRAPYFDPDAADYPELLHIAVVAWEQARAGSDGTPKQRIDRFLASRYPHLSGNARDLIAQIANWQRIGGRPKS